MNARGIKIYEILGKDNIFSGISHFGWAILDSLEVY
jgi:hypothetical protein